MFSDYFRIAVQVFIEKAFENVSELEKGQNEK